MRLNLVFTTLLLLFCCVAHSRTLSWDALEVSAQLDRDGRLHVIESHTMVFDGDWNGGERRFRVDRGQQFEFIALSAIDSDTNVKRPLKRGNLSDVGEYKFFDDHLLRWRARLPSDPPFMNAKRVYEIEYELAGIVRQNDSGYLLDHDFAFADRPGIIARFSLRLDIDPVWQTVDGPSHVVMREQILPGQGVAVRLPLSYSGADSPRAIAQQTTPSSTVIPWREVPSRIVTAIFIPTPAPWRYALLIGVVLFALARGVVWYRYEQRSGKFEPLTPSEQIDRPWLEQNVFEHAPEVVGAAWDLDTSASEVAAVLARMTQEGKLKSAVTMTGKSFWQREALQLTLLCERASLVGYERKLIDALFIDGGNTTDTDRVQKHYSKSGLDPSKLIKPALEQRLQDKVSVALPVPSATKWFTAMLLSTAFLLLVVGVIQDTANLPTTLLVAIPLAGMLLMGKIAAANYRKSVDALSILGRRVLVFIAIAIALLAFALLGIFFRHSVLQPIAFALATGGIVNSLFNGMRCRETLASLRFRKMLAAARRYFERQLQTATPQLDDAWYPYLLAFGLGKNADRWFKVNGSHDSHNRNVGSFGTSTSSSSTWTGGGGAFGGGGATGSWAAAAGGMAASIAAPSSNSSGGGGSSSGGSSSGGGGGGGW